MRQAAKETPRHLAREIAGGEEKQVLQLTNFDDSKLEAWKLIFAGVFVTHKRRASW